MAWETKTLVVEGQKVKGVQVREDRPYSLVRLDSARMSSQEQAAVIDYFSPGTQKKWGEGQYTLLRVQSTLLKYPEIREKLAGSPEAQETAGAPSQDFVYEGQISGKQLPYLRRWAAERGARIEEFNPMSTASGVVWQYRLISSGDLIERQKIQRDIERQIFKPTAMQEAIGGFTPTDKLITNVPSVETIQEKEKTAFISKVAKEKVEQQGAAARLRTLLSPEGVEYIGAVALGKDPTTIVQKRIEKDIRISLAGETKTDTFVRGVIEGAQSPVVEIETAFLGGAGFARLGATKIGAKVLSTTAAKGLLAVGASYYIGSSAVESYTDISMGRIEKGVGRALVTGAALGAGYAGAKVGAKAYAEIPTKIEAEIQSAKTKGLSKSVPETATEPGRMAGGFETSLKIGKKDVTIRGYIVGVSKSAGKGKSVQQVQIYIPGQKVGRISVKETTLIRTGTALKTGKGSFTVRTSEGAIIDTSLGKMDIVLAGSRRGTGYYIERGKVKAGDSTIRFITGSGTETSGNVRTADIEKAVKLIGKGISADRVGEIPRLDVRMKSIQDIAWIDISQPKAPPATKPIAKGWPGAAPGKSRGGPAPSPKLTEAPAPVAPTGKLSVTGPREALGLPTYTVTATAAAAAVSGVVARTARESRLIASIPAMKPMGSKKEKTYTATMNKAATVQLPKEMQRSKQATKPKADVDIYTRNIPDVDVFVSQSVKSVQASASVQKSPAPARTTESIIAPPAVPPVIEQPPPPRGGLAFPGLKIRSGFADKTRYKIKTVVNPIPAQLNIKLPKIKGV